MTSDFDNADNHSALSARSSGGVGEPLPGTLTPENFSYLFSRVTEGNDDIEPLFCHQDELCFCKSDIFPVRPKHVWLMDADDTLWEDNTVYERIIAGFISRVQMNSPQTETAELRKLIDEAEFEIIPQYGMGSEGFLNSMRLAYDRVRGKYDPHLLIEDEFFDSIPAIFSNLPEEIIEGTPEALTQLRDRGDALVLFTQGPALIQAGKVARSGLANKFHALAISKHKSLEMFQRVLRKVEQDGAKVVKVGNSLRSDILPAVELGLSAVHFENPNTWKAGNNASVDRTKYRTVRSLLELLDLKF